MAGRQRGHGGPQDGRHKMEITNKRIKGNKFNQ